MLSSSVQMLQHLVHGKVITLLKQVAQTWLDPESSSRFGGMFRKVWVQVGKAAINLIYEKLK